MTPLERVKEFFSAQPFPLEVILLDESTKTSPLAAQALGVEVGQIAKTLVFTQKGNNGQAKPVLVVTSGDVRVDLKKLHQLTGFKPRFAHGEEAEEITGFPPGGVCPFGIPAEIDVYIDVSMSRFPVVYAAGGTANSAVPITIEQLLLVTDGRMCDICM